MNDNNTKIAEMYNITNKIKAFETDLLKIPHVLSIEFDLNGFLDNMRQVIILPQHDITDNYFENMRTLKTNILKTAKKHGLTRTEDTIEDYGSHLYIVLNHDNTWLQKGNDQI